MATDVLRVNQKRQQAYEEVKASILESRRMPGTHCSERKLAEEYGVGRRVMREVLLMLASEGFITNLPGTGAFVRKYGLEEIHEQMYLREIIEGIAARFASQKINRLETKKLENLLKELEVAFEDKNMSELTRLDVAFHTNISKIAGNDVVQNLVAQGNGLKMMFGPKVPSMRLEAVKEHQETLNAIIDGDSEKAEACMRAHIRGASERVLAHLSKAESQSA